MKRQGWGGGDSRSGEAGAVLDDACEVVGVQGQAHPARLEPRVGPEALANSPEPPGCDCPLKSERQDAAVIVIQARNPVEGGIGQLERGQGRTRP
jgi:hypothetical protein